MIILYVTVGDTVTHVLFALPCNCWEQNKFAGLVGKSWILMLNILPPLDEVLPMPWISFQFMGLSTLSQRTDFQWSFEVNQKTRFFLYCFYCFSESKFNLVLGRVHMLQKMQPKNGFSLMAITPCHRGTDSLAVCQTQHINQPISSMWLIKFKYTNGSMLLDFDSKLIS